ncbi:arsinothricin resistance N-acetyltransferase ArsN1 [soil metagenome]
MTTDARIHPEMVEIRPATLDDAPAIAEIYNQGILGRMATFETIWRTPGDIETNLTASFGRYPYLVAVIDGQVMGWANVSSYRGRECYAGIGEFSIYVHEGARGKGVGKVLLPALVEAAETAGFWKLLSRVFLFNHASRRLCAAFGFREVGVYEKHAKLDDEWLEVVIVERLIPGNQT